MTMDPTTLVLRRYSLPPGAQLPAGAKIVSRDMLAAARSADDILSAASKEREQILQRAHAEAQGIAHSARYSAEEIAWRALEQATAELNLVRQALIEQCEALLMQSATHALGALLLDVPPDWPPLSSIRLLMSEWPGSQAAQLRLNPEDLESLPASLLSATAWQAVGDPAVQPGVCTLICAQGEVRACYQSNVRSLLAAFVSTTDTPEGNSHD